jgi:hypothetical protein
MNRRKFLSFLGIGPVVAVAAPAALSLEGPACVATATAAIIDAYNDYTNFSSSVLSGAFDDIVNRAAEECGKAVAKEIDIRTRLTFGGL